MRRPSDHSSSFERGELTDPEALEREMAESPEATLAPARLPIANGGGGRRSRARLDAARRGADRRGGSPHRPPKASEPQEHADRHLRRPDDGEPFVRPLLRLASRRRREERGPLVSGARRRRGRYVSPHPRLPGLRAPGPRSRLDGRALPMERRQERRLRLRERRRHGKRRVRCGLLPRGGRAVHPGRGRGVHAVRPVVLLDHGLHLSEPPLPVGRAERRPEVEPLPVRGPRPGDGLFVGDDHSTAQRQTASRSATTTRTCPSRRSTERVASRGPARSRSSMRTRRPATCLRSPSWTRPS